MNPVNPLGAMGESLKGRSSLKVDLNINDIYENTELQELKGVRISRKMKEYNLCSI